MAEPAHRSGAVALLGRPNAGKSTLWNRLVGERLAIVTPRPQTTRSRLLGVVSRPDAQLLLLDTPGLHEGRKALNRALDAIAREAAEDCDVALVLVDLARRGGSALVEELLARLAERAVPVVLAGTKLDVPGAREAPFPPEGAPAGAAALRVSARTGEGVAALLDALVARLPEGPRFHPEDALTDRPLRFLAAELVREAAFEALAQEVPYETAVEVEHFDDASRDDLVRIRATLLVERRTQKGIVVGRGGAMIRTIGTSARERLERLLGRRVHLDLWVKVEPRWSRRPKRLESLGYF